MFITRLLNISALELQREVELIWQHPFLFWILVLAITTFIMLVVTWFARRFKWLFKTMVVWILLIALIFILPLTLENDAIIYWSEIAFGILFAVLSRPKSNSQTTRIN
jgi:hypothetical protein